MKKAYNLENCIVCGCSYHETILGKSLFGYRHKEIEVASDTILFKVCKDCRRITSLSQAIKLVCNMKKEDFSEILKGD